MATYPTEFIAANFGVRALLTTIGASYLGRNFNTDSVPGKKHWIQIKEETFNNSCAYCGATDVQLSMEHLVMLNKTECGLHHPGNIVPSCNPCQSRSSDEQGRPVNWEKHLRLKNSLPHVADNRIEERILRIQRHIEAQNYPKLNSGQQKKIKKKAESLYASIVKAVKKASSGYEQD
jgi:hypothetical protein